MLDFSGIVRMLGSAWSGIVNAFSGLGQTVAGFGEGIVAGIEDMIDQASEFGSSLVDGISGFVDGISGFIDGISQGLEGFIGAVGGAVGGFVDAVSGFFQMLMLFGYLICGAVIIFLVLIVYLIYAFVKDKKYRRDIMMMQAQGTQQMRYARDVEVSRAGTTKEALEKI